MTFDALMLMLVSINKRQTREIVVLKAAFGEDDSETFAFLENVFISGRRRRKVMGSTDCGFLDFPKNSQLGDF